MERQNSYRWVVLMIGVLAQMTFSIGFSGIAVSGVVMQTAYHFNLKEVGFVLGCMGLGVTISELVWGMMTDKFGDKVVLILGLTLMGFSYLYIAFDCVPKNGYFPSYKYLGIMLIITGLVGGSVNSSSGHAVMLWFKESRRGFAMSIRQTAIPLGAAIGTILFPYIVVKKGFGLAFLTLAILCFLTSICVFIGLKIKEELEETDENYLDKEIISPYKRLTVWKVAMVGGVLTLPQMAIMTFGSIYLTDLYGMKMIYISIIIAGIQLGGGILRVVLGIMTDKYRNRIKLISVIVIVIGISAISLGLIPSEKMYITIFVLIILGLGANSWHGIGYTEIAEVATIKYAGRGLSMMGMVVFLVSFITPYIIPYVLKGSSWSMLWIIIGIITFLTLILLKKKEEG